MEPLWELTESVARGERFSLTESWTLGSAADAFLWSDFLGEPTKWLQIAKSIGGRYSAEAILLGGRYSTEVTLLGGRHSTEATLLGGSYPID